MSAIATMVAVHKPVPTQMVHSGAAVDLGLDWTVMEELAVVSVIVQLSKRSDNYCISGTVIDISREELCGFSKQFPFITLIYPV